MKILTLSSLLLLATPLFADEVLLGNLLKARYAMVVRDYDRALAITKEAMASQPNNADAAFLQTEIMLDLMKNKGIPSPEFEQDLLKKLQLGIEAFPKDYRFYMAMGKMLTAHFRFKRFSDFEEPAVYLREAIRLFNQTPGMAPSDLVETHYQLGLWYFSREQPFKAAESLETVCRLDGTRSWAFYYAGQACEQSGSYYSALNYLEHYQAMGLRDMGSGRRPLKLTTATIRGLIDPSPKNIEALIGSIKAEGERPDTVYDVALRFYRMENLSASLQVLDSSEKVKSHTPSLNLSMRIFMELHRYKDLLAYALDRLTNEQHPRIKSLLVEYAAEAALLAMDAEGLQLLSSKYGDLEGLSFRLDIYQACLDILLDQGTASWEQFMSSNENLEFVDFLKKEVSEKGVRDTVLEQVIQFYQVRRDWDGALTLLTSVHKSQLPPFYLWDDLADGFALVAQWDQAFEWYERILAKTPQRADILNNYGYFLTLRDMDLDRAKTMITQAVAAEPKSAAYLDSLAWVHFKTGDVLQAEHYLLAALAIEPNDPEKLDHLGDVQKALGNHRQAREAWSKALMLIQEQKYHLGSDRIMELIMKLDPPRGIENRGMAP